MWKEFDTYEGVEIKVDSSDGSFAATINGQWVTRKDLKALKREISQRTGADGFVKVMDQLGNVFDVVRVEGSSIRYKRDEPGLAGPGSEGVHEFTDNRNYGGKMLFPVDQEHIDTLAVIDKAIADLEDQVKKAKMDKTDLIKAYRNDESHKPYTRERLKNLLIASRAVTRAEKED